MLESFLAAGWKGRLLNLALWCLFIASLCGVAIGVFGVLAEATLNDGESSIWQLYWNGIQAEELWITYAALDTDLGSVCNTGGRVWVALCLIALFPLLAATLLTSIRILGFHVSALQPPSRWLGVEFGCTVLGALSMTLAAIVWGATCYRKSTSDLPNIAEMTPTGYVWIALCCGYLWLNVLGYLLIRRDMQGYRLGSIYGSELSDRNRPMTRSAAYIVSEPISPERSKVGLDDAAPLDMADANEL